MHYLDRNVRLIEYFIFKIFISWSSWQIWKSIWCHLQEEVRITYLTHCSLLLLEVTSNVPSFAEDAKFAFWKQNKSWFLPVCSPRQHCELHWHKMFCSNVFAFSLTLKCFKLCRAWPYKIYLEDFVLGGFCSERILSWEDFVLGNFLPGEIFVRVILSGGWEILAWDSLVIHCSD